MGTFSEYLQILDTPALRELYRDLAYSAKKLSGMNYQEFNYRVFDEMESDRANQTPMDYCFAASSVVDSLVGDETFFNEARRNND